MLRRAPHARYLLTAATVAVGVLAGCGSTQAQVHSVSVHQAAAPATPTSGDAEPNMVMITLADRGYHASDIAVELNQPVMFMLVNRGARPHELHADLPVSSLEVDDPAATGAQAAAVDRPGTLDVTVPAGHEIDVTFVPTQAGRFSLSDGQLAAGALVVG